MTASEILSAWMFVYRDLEKGIYRCTPNDVKILHTAEGLRTFEGLELEAYFRKAIYYIKAANLPVCLSAAINCLHSVLAMKNREFQYPEWNGEEFRAELERIVSEVEGTKDQTEGEL